MEIDMSSRSTKDDLNERSQQLRREHCARANRAHECLGSCLIDRGGIHLSCELCGDQNIEHEEPEAIAEVRAKAVVEAAGLKWDNLTEDARIEAKRAILVPWVPKKRKKV